MSEFVIKTLTESCQELADLVETLTQENKKLNEAWMDMQQEAIAYKSKYNDARSILESCGYCKNCLWDKESISDVVVQYDGSKLKEPVWPSNFEPLCESCTEVFKEMFE
jgi:hypothetical protein